MNVRDDKKALVDKLYKEGLQTHHINYDPEITIDILHELHKRFHGGGTGLAKSLKKREKPTRKKRTIIKERKSKKLQHGELPKFVLETFNVIKKIAKASEVDLPFSEVIPLFYDHLFNDPIVQKDHLLRTDEKKHRYVVGMLWSNWIFYYCLKNEKR